MEALAKHRYAKISPQKVRLVVDLVRGLPVNAAVSTLSFCPKKAAPLVRKVLESAVANAEHNFGMDIDDLRISKIYVDEGPTMKRFSCKGSWPRGYLF